MLWKTWIQLLHIVLNPFTTSCFQYCLKTNGSYYKTQLHDSTVSFSSPLLDEGYAPTILEHKNDMLRNKPLLIYLPGFDGTLVAPFLQFPELGTEFDVWGMNVSMKDRSTLEELKTKVLDFIISMTKKDKERHLYIMGESFGGILATEVALAIQNNAGKKSDTNLKGLVLINPATCYKRSNLAHKGPPIANGSSILYPLNLLKLLPLFTDSFALPQLLLILQAKGLPSVIDTPAREAYMGRMAFKLPSKLEFMTQDTLKWRLEKWLTTGCDSFEINQDLIRDVIGKLPVLIIAGEKDQTLPSVEESQRLSRLFGKAEVYVVNGSGHACTCGSRVDLTALMRDTFLKSSLGRKMMKKQAIQNEGKLYGLEPRYDGARIGLSPIKYWNEEYYQRLR
mmetsp:Transcript_6157/g.7805  ORF Transcript_6157/g.7805 Transcript_6157/m.7805 type:complete len:394 (+) Transcript_6157:30-1211(+)